MKKICFLILAIALATSCKKADISGPEITSGSLSGMSDTIRNTFSFNLVATDKSGIGKIELYIDDSLAASVNASPFIYDLNTLGLKEGDHKFKIIAYDQHGNTTTVSKDIVVYNLLLSLRLGELYDYEYKIVVSDESGNILASADMVKNSVQTILPATAFEGNIINFAYYVNFAGWSPVTAYVHVKRGSEYHLDLQHQDGPVNGVRVHLSNTDTSAISRIQVGTDRVYYTLNSLADTVNLPNTLPYSSGYKLLVQVWSSNGIFFRFYPVNNLPSISIDLATVDIPEGGYTVNYSGQGNVNCIMYGIVSSCDIGNQYYIGSSFSLPGNNWIDFHVPYGEFEQYSTYLQYTPTGSNTTYVDVYRGDVPVNMSMMNASLEFIDSSPANFSAISTGNYDYYIIDYDIIGQSADMQVYVPAGQTSWKLPDLAAAFGRNDLNFSQFSPMNITLSDFSLFDWNGKCYDLSADIEYSSFVDPHRQLKFINFDGCKREVRFSMGNAVQLFRAKGR